MLRTKLAEFFRAILSELVGEGRLPAEVLEIPIEISDPKNPEHGDFACNLALTGSKVAGMNPRALGEALAEKLNANFGSILSSVEVAGPGFINLRLHAEFVAGYVETVLTPDFKLESASRAPKPLKINVEFVSVNPNGPITIGSGRGAAYGSTLCKVLEAVGHTIHREYYINDGVNSEQMMQFASSVVRFVLERYFVNMGDNLGVNHQLSLDQIDTFIQSIGQSHGGQDLGWFESKYRVYVRSHPVDPKITATHLERMEDSTALFYLPKVLKNRYQLAYLGKDYRPPTEVLSEKHYKGDYVYECALEVERLLDDSQLLTALFSDEGRDHIRRISENLMLEAQRRALTAFGVEYDTWFSEQSLHDSGTVIAEIESMVEKGIADYSLTRTKLKMAKGGKIEDVLFEVQKGDLDDEEEHGNDLPEEIAPSDDPILKLDAEEIDREISEGSPTNGPEGVTLWLRSAKLGDDMDRVLSRRDGRLTYIASDVAYHKDKFNRPAGADKLITVLGPDHHGYIGRLTAVVAAMLMDKPKLGVPLEDEIEAKLYKDSGEKEACQTALAQAQKQLEVQIFQLVRFVKDGKPAPMRKRDGNIYALIDLMREIGTKLKPEGTEADQLEAGKDVARFFYLMRSHDTTFDFDLDLAEKQSDENPVFYVQYAHARICSVLAKAELALSTSNADSPLGNLVPPVRPSPTSPSEQVASPVSTSGLGQISRLLTHDREKALIKKIVDLPEEVRRASEDYGVHRIATYAIELARTFHYFYDGCRVIQADQPELSAARMKLCEATKRTLKTTLDLLGVSAPEKM